MSLYYLNIHFGFGKFLGTSGARCNGAPSLYSHIHESEEGVGAPFHHVLGVPKNYSLISNYNLSITIKHECERNEQEHYLTVL